MGWKSSKLWINVALIYTWLRAWLRKLYWWTHPEQWWHTSANKSTEHTKKDPSTQHLTPHLINRTSGLVLGSSDRMSRSRISSVRRFIWTWFTWWVINRESERNYVGRGNAVKPSDSPHSVVFRSKYCRHLLMPPQSAQHQMVSSQK